jgi:hypothetical protein
VKGVFNIAPIRSFFETGTGAKPDAKTRGLSTFFFDKVQCQTKRGLVPNQTPGYTGTGEKATVRLSELFTAHHKLNIIYLMGRK